MHGHAQHRFQVARLRLAAAVRNLVPKKLVSGPTAVLVVGLLAAIGGIDYCRSEMAPAPLRLTGVVVADEVTVATQMAGAIRELKVEEGSWVERGELIAILERDEIEAERSRQEAALDQLRAKLAQTDERLRLERERIENQIAGAMARLQLAESQHQEALVLQEQQRKNFDYDRTLAEEGLVARQQHEQMETELRVAFVRVQSSRDRVKAAEAELELARAGQRQLQLSAFDKEQLEAELDGARAELARIAARLRHSEIRAPRSGVVSLKVATEGEILKPGDALVTIVDLDDIWVRAQLEEGHLGKLALGRKLQVELASGEKVEGEVTFISPSAGFATRRDATRGQRDIRTFGMKVSVPNADRRVHPGMTAYVLLP